ncbi:hypothetical protein F7725_022470 [Dissostichus mawsoni]|uniref:Uncharacterized protein n=1 Tax=Dissostichus mawsoni TaxID=36200 RepID=A0A7J5YY16_DISMA|nr:hypothetical protein F7725_022470 [Dissostichus mawsoni]
MTADGKKHQGSVFFSFPDGTGLLYSLQGTAEPPKAEDSIEHELPAKTHHTEGQKDIVVPALATRDYPLSFFTYKEGQYNTKVTFHDEVSGEYLFYLVTFKATPPGVLSTMELVTAVRQTASATVQVENPLTTVTCLTTECKCPDISAPAQHTVPGQSKSTARLTLHSSDLGSFHYDLLLRALPPPPEKTVHFSTCLGSSQAVLVKFINYSRFKPEYSCKADCPDFTVDKVRTLVGSESGVEVCFEPHQLGQVTGQLTLSSGIGGEYSFRCTGSVSLPKPRVPSASGPVDNPCFTVKDIDTVPSKKTQNIVVSFESPAAGFPGPWFGNLTVSSQRSEAHRKPCSWIFYLKGYRPESS